MKKRTIHIISVSGGKDSTATLDLALDRVGKKNVVGVYCDTGNEHPAVYQYLKYLEKRFKIKIVRLTADFTSRIVAKRMFIARDQRTRREYDIVPVFDANDKPVPKRDAQGKIVTKTVNRGGLRVQVPVQKTKKVGGGRRVRWSNKAKRRALAVLQPTGNPYLDLCLWKGRFPSRKAQFCTEYLKTNMLVAYQAEWIDKGYNVVSWQGVRRDESENRRHAKKIERLASGLWAFRPLVDWTADQVFELHRKHRIDPNPLYLQGMGRVGCMPCINVNKAELREIASRFPDEIEKIAKWEQLVGAASKRGFSTFKCDSHKAKDRREIFADLNIQRQVRWSRTTRGGKQYDLLALVAPAECSSSYGLCA